MLEGERRCCPENWRCISEARWSPSTREEQAAGGFRRFSERAKGRKSNHLFLLILRGIRIGGGAGAPRSWGATPIRSGT